MRITAACISVSRNVILSFFLYFTIFISLIDLSLAYLWRSTKAMIYKQHKVQNTFLRKVADV